VLLCMYDTRASLPSEVRADIERFLNSARGSQSAWAQAEILPTFIRRNIKLAEAPSYGQTIFEYDPTCNGAEDYKRVADFFLGIDEQPAQGHSGGPPIQIRAIHLPAPQCYSPVPLWTAPAQEGSRSAHTDPRDDMSAEAPQS
jgi:hypothetical protein